MTPYHSLDTVPLSEKSMLFYRDQHQAWLRASISAKAAFDNLCITTLLLLLNIDFVVKISADEWPRHRFRGFSWRYTRHYQQQQQQ
jgi:hypothetical protein